MHISEESLREALGSELSDMMYRQKALVLCNERIGFWSEDFRKMADDDQRQMEQLEIVISTFGKRMAPRRSTEQLTDLLIDVVAGASSQSLEKLEAYTMLKTNQMMAAHLIRKAMPEVLPDIRMTLAPLEGILSNLNWHLNLLKNFMDHTGVAWLTGHAPTESMLDRAFGAVSDLAERVMHRRTSPNDDREIFSVLQMDHRKLTLLFKEIEESKTHERALGIFRQMKAELITHSLAEEESVYMRFQAITEMMEYLNEARQDHADMRVLLEEATDHQDEHEAFLDKIDELHQLVAQHVEEEENQLFKLIRKNSSEELRRDLCQDFLKAKQRLQENVGSDMMDRNPAQQPSAPI